jgi:hypothetical protein
VEVEESENMHNNVALPDIGEALPAAARGAEG